MPTITLNKTVFEKLVGKELPLEQLKDRISMLGTDLEKIEGNEIHVEIFPNRPDLLSEQGFARAFSSFIGVKTGLRKYEVKKSGEKIIVDPSVSMRPYTACAIVKNLTFSEERIKEIMQVQEKLAVTFGRNRKKSAYGIYPIDKITFPVTYIAKDPSTVTFWPLGMEGNMNASEVLEKHPKGQTYKHLTESWKKYPFFIDAKQKVMCMLPFTNSHDTGKVDDDTKDVFVECTGNDLQNVQLALNIITTVLADMGGQIYSLDIEYPDKTITTPDLTPKKMDLDLSYINKLLGLKLGENKVKDLLEKMGFGYEKGEVLIPAYRADILHQADLVEDIAIAYGYENFEEEIPNVATIGEESQLEKLSRKIRDILIGLRLLEVKNYHLTTREDLNEKLNVEEDVIPLQNALGEHNHLRNKILSSLLKNLADNQHHEYPQNLFEIGRVFTSGKSETGIVEKEHLAVVLCHEKTDFTEVKQVLDTLMQSFGIEYEVKESSHPSYIKGRVGEIILDGKKVGVIGELHPTVIEKWGMLMPIVCLEMDVDLLLKVTL
ncbi:phenylalanine--tRNA ligase subunit beta [Candidatus Woesearchaeota archaeon CG10_big_fil_rev_8_21_14_0_10_45_16]|nr:MAG: phenylalanine--tRNA ligase subunit beta [Candidatus Woesearchaeota archaeon CG10_big_fil_rev_8_21_14_0_10_45_16]